MEMWSADYKSEHLHEPHPEGKIPPQQPKVHWVLANCPLFLPPTQHHLSFPLGSSLNLIVGFTLFASWDVVRERYHVINAAGLLLWVGRCLEKTSSQVSDKTHTEV